VLPTYLAVICYDITEGPVRLCCSTHPSNIPPNRQGNQAQDRVAIASPHDFSRLGAGIVAGVGGVKTGRSAHLTNIDHQHAVGRAGPTAFVAHCWRYQLLSPNMFEHIVRCKRGPFDVVDVLRQHRWPVAHMNGSRSCGKTVWSTRQRSWTGTIFDGKRTGKAHSAYACEWRAWPQCLALLDWEIPVSQW
jgi:hypothetical protein